MSVGRELVSRARASTVVAPDRVADSAPLASLQHHAGNSAVAELISATLWRQSGPAAAPAPDAPAVAAAGPAPPVIDRYVEEMMREDVEEVVDACRDDDAGKALRRVQKWHGRDENHRRRTGFEGTVHLDRFLAMLKRRTFTESGFRSLWVDQWTNAYDALWHLLEGGDLFEFMTIVSSSKREATKGPAFERMESVWSYVGKREALAGLGIVKGMSTTLAGIGDLGAWALGADLSGGGLSGQVASGFDEMAGAAAQEMGVDVKEEALLGLSAYSLGTTGGKVAMGLAVAGAAAQAGTAGQALGIVQTAKAVEDLGSYIKRLRTGPPPLSWSQIAARPDVWAQVVGVVGAGIGVRSATVTAPLVKATMQELGIVVGIGQTALLVAAYQAVDDDRTVPEGERAQRKADLLAEIATTGALTIDARYGERFKAAWERRAAAPDATGSPAGAIAEPAPTLETARLDDRGGEVVTLYHGTSESGLEGMGALGEGKLSVAHSAGEHQDLSQGIYLSEDISVAQSSAKARASQQGGAGQHVLRFDIPTSELGVIVDIRPGGPQRAAWDAFLAESAFDVAPQMGTRREYLGGLGVEQRGVVFEEFLQRIGMKHADTVMGPIGDVTTTGAVTSVRGESTQVCIRSQRVADRLNAIIRGK
jgi:hypothetical protein